MNINLKSLTLLLASGASFSMESNAVSERENKYNKGQSPCQWMIYYWGWDGAKELVSADKDLLKTDISPSFFKVLLTPGGNDLSLLYSIFGKKNADKVEEDIDDDLKAMIEFKGKTFDDLKKHVLDRIRDELPNSSQYSTVTGDTVSNNHTVRSLMEEGLVRAKTVNPNKYTHINTAEDFINTLKTSSDMLPREMIPVLNIIFPSLPTIVLMTRNDTNYVPQLYFPNNTVPPIFIYHERQGGSDYSRMDRRIIKRPKTISQLVKK